MNDCWDVWWSRLMKMAELFYRREPTLSLMNTIRVSVFYKALPKWKYYAAAGTGLTLVLAFWGLQRDRRRSWNLRPKGHTWKRKR